jgi:soluble lytic murein transglycosylase-like protein
LQARSYSFLKSEVLLLLLLIPLLSAGCANRVVWGLPADTLSARIAAGDFDLLAAIDWDKEDPADALRLGPQAPFYLSFALQATGSPGPARRLLEVAWARTARPWKDEAGALLAAGFLAEKDYRKSIETARGVLALRPPADPSVQHRARRTLAEALYWNRDDALALEESARLGEGDAEALLLRAVSAMRLGRPEARGLFLELFLRQRLSALHARAYPFLLSDPAYLDGFTQAERNLLEAKYHFTQGSWVKGIGLMEGALQSLAGPGLDGATVFAEMGTAYAAAGRQPGGARFLEGLASRLTGQARADALEQAGRLYRRAREYAKAMAVLRAAAGAARFTEQQDRARWHVLDILLTTEPKDLVEQVQAEAAQWNVPSYFEDLLEKRIAGLVAARKWSELARMRTALAASGPDSVVAQLVYILARARQEGLVTRLPGSPPASARDFFREAARLNEGGYYGMMAAVRLGEVPAQTVAREEPGAVGLVAVAGGEPGDPGSADGGADDGVGYPVDERSAGAIGPGPSAGGSSSLDPVTMGFFSYGLAAEASRRAWAQRAALSDAQLLEAARRLAAGGEVRGSLYLVGFLRQRRTLSQAEQTMYYPRAFSSLIDGLASRLGIAACVLYALVREESYFDPRAVSSAGAVGLSQLMPVTADQVARKLGMKDPDLRDPAVNLEVGARHLKDLLRSAGSTPKALLAYNAGLTRVRTWEKTSKGLPMDLFMEAVPFEETRGYVRKILVSAVMYARLYDGKDPRETAAEFFELRPRPLDEPVPPAGASMVQPD